MRNKFYLIHLIVMELIALRVTSFLFLEFIKTSFLTIIDEKEKLNNASL